MLRKQIVCLEMISLKNGLYFFELACSGKQSGAFAAGEAVCIQTRTVNDMRSLTWQRSQELLRVNVLSTGLRSSEVCEAEMSILHQLLLKGHLFKSEQIFLGFFLPKHDHQLVITPPENQSTNTKIQLDTERAQEGKCN